MSQEQEFERHELSALFPDMAPEEFDGLVKSIQEDGLREEIIVGQPSGKIVDGWHRYLACIKAGVKPKFKFMDENEDGLTREVWIRNLKRRHLSETQRATLVLMTLAEEKLLPTGVHAGKGGQSLDELAREAGVSRATMVRAKKGMQAGRTDEMLAGKTTAREAASDTEENEKTDSDKVPGHQELMNTTLEALRALGGSASIREITNRVIEDMKLSSDIAQTPHNQKGAQTRLEYNLAWARTYLKKHGLIDNSARGVWSLTAEGRKKERANPEEVSRAVQQSLAAQRDATNKIDVSDDSPDKTTRWREDLRETILNMPPAGFERLCQRLLRESGFVDVEVTGKAGDGGIDGHGRIRLNGLVSFRVAFQCKRYSSSVTPNLVRDFRGAMQGRADRGIIITTGNFTRDAQQEATRDGGPLIDLIDGELLIDKLKELKLGVSEKMVEIVEVDKNFFDAI